MPEFYHRPGGKGTPAREVSDAHPLPTRVFPPEPATASGSLDAVGEYVYLTLPGVASTISVQVTGVYVGTLTFEASATLGAYVAVKASDGTTAATTTTTTGLFSLGSIGRGVRVRMTAYTSGAAYVTIVAHSGGGASSSSGGGTQYETGAAAASPTGTQINWNESGTQRDAGVAKPLPVRSYTSDGVPTDSTNPLQVQQAHDSPDGYQVVFNGVAYVVQRAVVSFAASGANSLVAASGSTTKGMILSLCLIAQSAVDFWLADGAATGIFGTTTNRVRIPAGGNGLVLQPNQFGWNALGADNSVINCHLSAAVACAGSVTYIYVDA